MAEQQQFHIRQKVRAVLEHSVYEGDVIGLAIDTTTERYTVSDHRGTVLDFDADELEPANAPEPQHDDAQSEIVELKAERTRLLAALREIQNIIANSSPGMRLGTIERLLDEALSNEGKTDDGR